MAREILFKAKQVDSEEWIEGSYVKSKRINEYARTEAYILTCDDEIKRRLIYIDESTICQYTGLPAYWYDFENEPQESDVWEHDLLEVVHNGKKVIAEVKYEGGMFILASDEFKDSYIPLFDVVQVEDDYWVDAKVLGNVFDNPELLEVLS